MLRLTCLQREALTVLTRIYIRATQLDSVSVLVRRARQRFRVETSESPGLEMGGAVLLVARNRVTGTQTDEDTQRSDCPSERPYGPRDGTRQPTGAAVINADIVACRSRCHGTRSQDTS